ncbi:protein dead ringer [Sarcoptes scabiei]|nr:protein dead ringer [Sarcoptes scabiei]
MKPKGVFPSPTLPYITLVGRRWARSAMFYGGAGALAITFFCDWKAVLQYVPVINDRFKEK